MKSWRPPKVELITATDLMKRLEEAGEKSVAPCSLACERRGIEQAYPGNQGRVA